MTDLNPIKLGHSKIDITILCFLLPLLLTTIMWIPGLILVLTIPPATFLLVFLIWIFYSTLVTSLPPIVYIVGWIFFIFGLQNLF